jgi:hypothetical protein
MLLCFLFFFLSQYCLNFQRMIFYVFLMNSWACTHIAARPLPTILAHPLNLTTTALRFTTIAASLAVLEHCKNPSPLFRGLQKVQFYQEKQPFSIVDPVACICYALRSHYFLAQTCSSTPVQPHSPLFVSPLHPDLSSALPWCTLAFVSFDAPLIHAHPNKIPADPFSPALLTTPLFYHPSPESH